jgi:hypothetical protein
MKKIQGPDNAVAHFTDPTSKQPVWVIPREGEDHADAIKRVATDHNVDPGSVKTGSSAEVQGLNPIEGLITDLSTLASSGDVNGSLLKAKSIVAELEKELGILASVPKDDEDKLFSRERTRGNAAQQFLSGPAKAALPGMASLPSKSYDNLFARP